LKENCHLAWGQSLADKSRTILLNHWTAIPSGQLGISDPGLGLNDFNFTRINKDGRGTQRAVL
jgi:hypothetical protein